MFQARIFVITHKETVAVSVACLDITLGILVAVGCALVRIWLMGAAWCGVDIAILVVGGLTLRNISSAGSRKYPLVKHDLACWPFVWSCGIFCDCLERRFVKT